MAARAGNIIGWGRRSWRDVPRTLIRRLCLRDRARDRPGHVGAKEWLCLEDQVNHRKPKHIVCCVYHKTTIVTVYHPKDKPATPSECETSTEHVLFDDSETPEIIGAGAGTDIDIITEKDSINYESDWNAIPPAQESVELDQGHEVWVASWGLNLDHQSDIAAKVASESPTLVVQGHEAQLKDAYPQLDCQE